MSCWPLPSKEKFFDTIQESAYITAIHISWGFYQLPMEPDSQNYTEFKTPFGSVKRLRMPVGLTGSPNTFQSLMQHMLVGLTWSITVPHLDDRIIFPETPDEHKKKTSTSNSNISHGESKKPARQNPPSFKRDFKP